MDVALSGFVLDAIALSTKAMRLWVEAWLGLAWEKKDDQRDISV